MAVSLYGEPVTENINRQVGEKVAALKAQGLTPTLAIVRVGEDSAALAYEKGAKKRAEITGVRVRVFDYPAQISQEALEKAVTDIDQRQEIHGILLFQPLPDHLDQEAIRRCISPRKDVDGITLNSSGGIYENHPIGHAPCTAQAVVTLLDYYGIPVEGRRVVVLGRSLVIGKPVAMMLLHQNATVTLCHSRTEHLEEITRQGDILIVAAGKARWIDDSYLKNGQTVIDVGINFTQEGKLVGDVKEESIAEMDVKYTPVPGGVGGITSSLLMEHVVDSLWTQVKQGA